MTTIYEQLKEQLMYWDKYADVNQSYAEETDSNWEKYVSVPAITHKLAPREARAILEISGLLADYGLKPYKVLRKAIKEVDKWVD